MKLVQVTANQIKQRCQNRPSIYIKELEPAKVRDLPDGGIEYDKDHPAWKAAVIRYADKNIILPTIDYEEEGLF